MGTQGPARPKAKGDKHLPWGLHLSVHGRLVLELSLVLSRSPGLLRCHCPACPGSPPGLCQGFSFALLV